MAELVINPSFHHNAQELLNIHSKKILLKPRGIAISNLGKKYCFTDSLTVYCYNYVKVEIEEGEGIVVSFRRITGGRGGGGYM